MTPSPIHPRIRAGQLAHLALAAVIAKENGIAEDTLCKLAEEQGLSGIVTAMCDWADQATAHQRGEASQPGVIAQPVWQRQATGERVDATQVDDQVAVWTGQFVAARLALDNPACKALIDVVPGDQWSEYAATMLATCAAMINHRATGGELN